MIALSSDCLMFQLASGESMPFSADMISVEVQGQTSEMFDQEFVQHAANAVFHYYKHEMGKATVTVGEFAGALEKVLQGFTPVPVIPSVPEGPVRPIVVESDLRRLAKESGSGCELFFFPRLRDELRQQLTREPRVLRFRGLRGCVKHLVGTQRRDTRCRRLEDQIVLFLRECLSADARHTEVALVVE